MAGDNERRHLAAQFAFVEGFTTRPRLGQQIEQVTGTASRHLRPAFGDQFADQPEPAALEPHPGKVTRVGQP